MKKSLVLVLMAISMPVMAQFDRGSMALGYNTSISTSTSDISGLDFTGLEWQNRFQVSYFLAKNFSLGLSFGVDQRRTWSSSGFSLNGVYFGTKERTSITSPFAGVLLRYYLPLSSGLSLYAQGSYERGMNFGALKVKNTQPPNDEKYSANGGYHIVFGGGLGLLARVSDRFGIEAAAEYKKTDLYLKMDRGQNRVPEISSKFRDLTLRIGVIYILSGSTSVTPSSE